MDYFVSYEDLEVHKLMLQDRVRNHAYKQAIFDNEELIKGKVVLDVGAGTGILSIFCAQAGASKVYAVEASDTYKIAEQIVKENKFENIIQVIHDRIENVTLPNNEKVDAIVSEWMGFYLLHEGMLDSVIFARDKFLKAGGAIFPETATLYAVPCSVPNMFDTWADVDGISMTSFGNCLRASASKKPETSTVLPEHVLANSESVLWIDLREAELKDLDNIIVEHIVVANKQASYQGLCLWFTCTFPSTLKEPVILSTDPEDEATHWRQTTIVLPASRTLEVGEPVAYSLSLRRDAVNSRRYDIEVTMLDADAVQHPDYCTCYLTKCILTRAVLERYETGRMGAGGDGEGDDEGDGGDNGGLDGAAGAVQDCQ